MPTEFQLEELFPSEKDREKFFALSKRFFEQNPTAKKLRRKDKSKPKKLSNSIINVENKEYMLAGHTDDDAGILGTGVFAKAKLAMDEDGTCYAVRIERKKTQCAENLPITLGKKIGLIYGVMTRTSTSQKNTGDRPPIKATGDTEYQVQKLGVSLSDFLFLNKNTLTRQEKFQIAIRLSMKLSEFHEMGYAHYDIKPANVLINSDTHEISLLDLDFARQELDTLQKIFAGTPLYVPGADNLPRYNGRQRDIHALIKTIFFPREPVQTYYKTKKNNSIKALAIFDSEEFKNFFDVLYIRENNVASPKPYLYCEDLAIKLIEKENNVKIKNKKLNSVKLKNLFLQKYDEALSIAIQTKKPITQEIINTLIEEVHLNSESDALIRDISEKHNIDIALKHKTYQELFLIDYRALQYEKSRANQSLTTTDVEKIINSVKQRAFNKITHQHGINTLHIEDDAVDFFIEKYTEALKNTAIPRDKVARKTFLIDLIKDARIASISQKRDVAINLSTTTQKNYFLKNYNQTLEKKDVEKLSISIEKNLALNAIQLYLLKKQKGFFSFFSGTTIRRARFYQNLLNNSTSLIRNLALIEALLSSDKYKGLADAVAIALGYSSTPTAKRNIRKKIDAQIASTAALKCDKNESSNAETCEKKFLAHSVADIENRIELESVTKKPYQSNLANFFLCSLESKCSVTTKTPNTTPAP